MGATFWKNIYTKLLTSGGIEWFDGRIKTNGSGSPEGVVTATVGSEYTDTSTGILWQKRSGSGNTGWQAGEFSGFANGSVTNPGAYFSSETDVGIYYESGQITFAGDGNALFRINKATGGLASVVDSTVGTDYLSMHPAYFCRAWVNFNGTGTVAIRASGNVSSITDNNTGDYTVNFTTALPDADYSISQFIAYLNNSVASANVRSMGNCVKLGTSLRMQSVYISTTNGGATTVDEQEINIGIFR